MNARPYDVLVIGAGSVGMSAGYHLARRGARVLLIDAFDPPHREGSHHGETRLIRHAYKKGRVYIPLALRADELWRELEREAETTLLVRSGVLNIADPEHYSFGSRPEDARAFGIPVEMLDAAEMRRRWPGLALPDHFIGMYEPEAGYLYCERAIAVCRRLAEAAGAKLVANAPVLRVAADGTGIAAETAEGVFRAEKALLSAGAWFGRLEPFVKFPLKPLRIPVAWFATESGDYRAGRFPGFTLHTAEGGFYGFPDIDGGGLKIGKHDGGREWRPGEPFHPFGHEESDEASLRGAVRQYMPKAAGRLLRSSVCRYEFTPDEDFVIDRHPQHPNVLVIGGLSGHGFKFASVLGEIAADLLLDGRTRFDLGAFALDRFSAGPSGL
ncbi:MAG: N-methyltryptophan oxidase [Thermobacillus sp. ZCTH02-B1]|uniref:N-methyl-L-tryptophan oxidase n=1 Tax=Thermobacillus sp. ZCTH02-B1 TaxID=1858795 RepID=UPI000B56D9AB|nr:N-methyl-L-tryptophan oxidase [Thermobacillus sp. ZCTH02-B1]OUM94771.1 MAG: N-methyltryptophan oxidase [Thermobacillus sp. ZCTH02-B1]